MKITDIQPIELAGPEFSTPIRSAWTPGSSCDRAVGTIVRIKKGQTRMELTLALVPQQLSWYRGYVAGFQPA